MLRLVATDLGIVVLVLLVISAAAVLLFAVGRAILLWYLKIDTSVALLREQASLLREVRDLLARQAAPEVDAPRTTPVVPVPWGATPATERERAIASMREQYRVTPPTPH